MMQESYGRRIAKYAQTDYIVGCVFSAMKSIFYIFW